MSSSGSRGLRAPVPKPSKSAKRSTALEGLDVNEGLFERLRELRRTIAAEQGVPAYVVFSDRSLADMAARRPENTADFLECHGVGKAKLERYGDAFLQVIAET